MSNLTTVRTYVPKGTLFVGNACHVMALTTVPCHDPCQERRSSVLRKVASCIDADVDCKRGAYKEPLVQYILPGNSYRGKCDVHVSPCSMLLLPNLIFDKFDNNLIRNERSKVYHRPLVVNLSKIFTRCMLEMYFFCQAYQPEAGGKLCFFGFLFV